MILLLCYSATLRLCVKETTLSLAQLLKLLPHLRERILRQEELLAKEIPDAPNKHEYQRNSHKASGSQFPARRTGILFFCSSLFAFLLHPGFHRFRDRRRR